MKKLKIKFILYIKGYFVLKQTPLQNIKFVILFWESNKKFKHEVKDCIKFKKLLVN